MKTTKKAARIGGDQLEGCIAAASANAKSRIEKMGGKDVDGVAGGIGNMLENIIDIGGTTTQGMAPPDDTLGTDDFGA